MRSVFIHKTIVLALLLIVSLCTHAQFYNGMQMPFGRSRIQYEERFWSFYRFDRFETYFYQGGKNLAVYAAQYAHASIAEIEDFYGATVVQPIQFVVYNNLSDLKQSNIGLSADVSYNIGGVTNIVGNKITLYFNGDYTDFRQQVRAGIAQVLFNQLIYGEDIASMFKNQALYNLSDWFVNGFVSYVARPWDTEIDDRLRDALLYGKLKRIYRLEGPEATLAGHSLWNYVAMRYGEPMLPSILYITKISHNIETSFNYVLGISFKQLLSDWQNYYKQRYVSDTTGRQPITIKHLPVRTTRNKIIKHIELAQDTSLLSYVSFKLDRYKVYVKDTLTRKKKRILRGGFKMHEKVDYSYPVLHWHPSGKLLTIITEKKGILWMYYYLPEEKRLEKQKFFDVEKVLDFNFSDDGRLMVMSAVKDGQSDIFIHDRVSHSNEQITNDVYDDLYPCFINSSKAILFSSNRTDDTLKTTDVQKMDVTLLPETKDLFMYERHRGNTLTKRITNTPLHNELFPQHEGYYKFLFLSDRNGIYNRYAGRFDSTISFIDTSVHYSYYTDVRVLTNKPASIREQSLSHNRSSLTELIHFKNKDRIQLMSWQKSSQKEQELSVKNTFFMQQLLDANADASMMSSRQRRLLEIKKKQVAEQNSKENNTINQIDENSDSIIYIKQDIDIHNYVFGDMTERMVVPRTKVKDTTSKKPMVAKQVKPEVQAFIFGLPKQQNLDIEFSMNRLVTQMDFDYLGQNYQPFGGGTGFENPGLNLNFKVGVVDLLEDYRITGGIALSPNLRNNEYLLSFANVKQRWDKEFIFHRQTIEAMVSSEDLLMKFRMHNFYYQLKYPFTPVFSFKGTAIYKNNRYVFLSNTLDNLKQKDMYLNWGGAKAELVFDNTRDGGLNILFGTRYKLFTEYNQLIEDKTKNIVVVGLDYRKYIRIHRCFIWANRFAASTSFGTYKLIYYLGGVDGWLFPKFNQMTSIASDQNYIYQTLATNMRGFQQNVRNGNSFAVMNSELRFPIVRYFANKPMRSEMFYHLQLIGFADVGTAWTGPNPYSEENSLYKTVYHAKPITVIVYNQKEPLVGGFGWGLRTKLLGYFVRADWAWGIEDRVITPRVFYLSFSLDF